MPATPSDPVPALTLEGVSFGYRNVPVVREVSIDVARGEMVGLLGPNGAGKSTLLKLASGVLNPERGRVLLGDDDVRTLSRRELARRVSVVPQDFAVQFAFTVRQIVELGRTPHVGVWGVSRAADRHAVDVALEATGTSELAGRAFNELSGGERQRVLLALALAQDAPVVLLDEPTAHLDIKHQVEVLELLRHFNVEQHLTVVAALHDLNLAARYFSRLVLFQGAIVADGPPTNVLDSTLLASVYGTPVQVGILRGEEHLSVLPPGAISSAAGPHEARAGGGRAVVHVIAGGGAGELMMRALADAGIAFSAGPLNFGDSDCALAERLAVQCIVEPPYAPVSPEGLAAMRERIVGTAAVVLCPMPLGHGNVAVVEAALEACRAGVPAIVLEPALGLERHDAGDWQSTTQATAILNAIRARDYSGRGEEVYAALSAAGARWASAPAEVLALLKDLMVI